MKIIGQNIYLSSEIFEEDLSYLAECWDEYLYYPHSESSKSFFKITVDRCNKNFDYSLNTKGRVWFVVRDKSSDKAIGYTHLIVSISRLSVDFAFTILHPETRNKGIYSELNILRHKYVYREESPIERTNIRVSKNSPRQENSLISLYTRVTHTETLIRGGEFDYSYILKDEWNEWINSPEREEKKNAYYEEEF